MPDWDTAAEDDDGGALVCLQLTVWEQLL